ncbi:hypothetical protein Droror1_Dr00006763 [Drosera rotundifolia]
MIIYRGIFISWIIPRYTYVKIRGNCLPSSHFIPRRLSHQTPHPHTSSLSSLKPEHHLSHRWIEGLEPYWLSITPLSHSGLVVSRVGVAGSKLQPAQSQVPGVKSRFNAKLILEKLRNKRVVFVGDSIGRNQWESALCMLASGVRDQSSIYEVNGNPITKHMGFLVFKIKEYNCTMEYYRAPYLVVQGRPPVQSPRKVKYSLRLDVMDWSSGK